MHDYMRLGGGYGTINIHTGRRYLDPIFLVVERQTTSKEVFARVVKEDGTLSNIRKNLVMSSTALFVMIGKIAA